MTTPVKFLITIAALAALAFAGFGFLATFEPNPVAKQWSFRIVYAAISLLSLFTLLRIWRRS